MASSKLNKNNRVIVVLGMHRSGTSVITRSLPLMDVDIGNSFISRIEGVNDKGFWEDSDLNVFNEDILKELKLSWSSLTAINFDDLDMLCKKGYLDRADDLLRQKVTRKGIFGFKDPRTTKLLPFWKKVFHRSSFDVSYIFAVRNPLSVVKSLAKREAMEEEKAYLLWLGYVVPSLSNIDNNCVFIDFDLLMQSPESEIYRLAKHLNLKINEENLQDYKTEFLDQDLRHTVYTLSDLQNDSACPPIVHEVHSSLMDLSSDRANLDDITEKLRYWVVEFERLKSIMSFVDRCETQAVNQNKLISELDTQVTNIKHSLVAEAEKNSRIISSKSWVITKPFRWLSRICCGDILVALDLIKNRILLKSEVNSSLNIASNPPSCSPLLISDPIKPSHPTAVILPVYRGIEMTKRCILAALPNVLANKKAKLLAINDASPDNGMQEMLEQLATQWPDRLLVLENESNLGFVRTVNRGLAYFSQYDVVLLNSDVIVPKDWLSRLIDEAYSRPNIGTVTPFSNNSTISSFPYFCQENAQPFDLDVDSIDAVFKHEKLPCIEAPTGVGFCMYIRRACLDKVGYLNEDKFGRGYGEENDLCQRALKSGWLNLISPNIYVFHEGGVSFSSDKQALVDHAMRVIDELHPNYHSDVRRFIKSDPIKHARVTRYVQLLAAIAIPKVLHVSHSLGGGVKQHIEELGEYYGSRIVNILLAPFGNKGEVNVSLGMMPHADSIIFSISFNYEHMLELLKGIGISAVHFHHAIGLDSKLLQLSTDLSVARLITTHDYYWLFGNPTLTDGEGNYPGFYSDQIHNPLYRLPHGMTVKAWQEPLHSFFEGADCVIFPSGSTKIIFDNVYNPDKSVVAPHVEPHVNVNTSPINFAQRDVYTIGVLGALGKEKGADTLEELATKAKKAGLKFNFKLIGYAYRSLKLVEKTGPYETKELKDLIKEHQLDILLFTAQWPETYSYTLSYALDSGLPIIAPNIGAFPERLSGRTNVVLFNYLNPVSELLDKLNTFVEQMSKNIVVKAPVFENDISKHDFYKHEYTNMVSRNLKFTEISKQRPFHIDPTWIVAQGFMNKNSSWRNAIIHILWRLCMSPYLRWFTNAMPLSVKRAFRHALCVGNSHEIARGAKDK